MQVTGIQGAEEKSPGARCSAADISVDTAIPADICQNHPMAYLHTVHVPGQGEIIQTNPFAPLFLAPRLPVRPWRPSIHRRITTDIADEGQVGILQNCSISELLAYQLSKSSSTCRSFSKGITSSMRSPANSSLVCSFVHIRYPTGTAR